VLEAAAEGDDRAPPITWVYTLRKLLDLVI
jgi:hypothetical protein